MLGVVVVGTGVSVGCGVSCVVVDVFVVVNVFCELVCKEILKRPRNNTTITPIATHSAGLVPFFGGTGDGGWYGYGGCGSG